MITAFSLFVSCNTGGGEGGGNPVNVKLSERMGTYTGVQTEGNENLTITLSTVGSSGKIDFVLGARYDDANLTADQMASTDTTFKFDLRVSKLATIVFDSATSATVAKVTYNIVPNNDATSVTVTLTKQ